MAEDVQNTERPESKFADDENASQQAKKVSLFDTLFAN